MNAVRRRTWRDLAGRLALGLSALLLASRAVAVPQLKTQAEVIAAGELKAKVLASAEGLPAATPQAHFYVFTRGSEKKQVKMYAPADLWRRRAFAGAWKDKKGNVMRLARVKSLVPSFAREHATEEDIEKGLDELEKSFKGDEAELAEWRRQWGAGGVGRFFTAKNGVRYYVEFDFAEAVKDADAQKMLKTFEKSVSTIVSGGASFSSLKWWTSENELYRFMTDLDKAKGGKFVSDTMRLMAAMRKAYETYVPPQKTLGKCTVRVFRSIEGYRSYLADNKTGMEWSCGLWDPSREELLVSAHDREQALDTMRHEAFHQYLHYATGSGHHAMWFNEGHACFFENVKYNPAKNTVRVTDEGSRARYVDRNPARIAAAIPAVVAKSYQEFYGGSPDEVNLNYAASWAAVYFLEKGAYAADEFAPYRGICAKYLELTAQGVDSAEATRRAWALAEGRDFGADFVKFWTKLRKRALAVR
ncbi:MAG: DUF1570 domain-containing protein [Kiritimatiellae bacterium]|nr:DUF1570 domain-containing protein [Kiritimatiellia bacterium]